MNKESIDRGIVVFNRFYVKMHQIEAAIGVMILASGLITHFWNLRPSWTKLIWGMMLAGMYFAIEGIIKSQNEKVLTNDHNGTQHDLNELQLTFSRQSKLLTGATIILVISGVFSCFVSTFNFIIPTVLPLSLLAGLLLAKYQIFLFKIWIFSDEFNRWSE